MPFKLFALSGSQELANEVAGRLGISLGLHSSPSWIPAYEQDTKDGLLSEVPKETLIELAQEQGATAHHTKDEIVEMLEIKTKTLRPYFDDNLVG